MRLEKIKPLLKKVVVPFLVLVTGVFLGYIWGVHDATNDLKKLCKLTYEECEEAKSECQDAARESADTATACMLR